MDDRSTLHGLADPDACTHAPTHGLLINFFVENVGLTGRVVVLVVRDDELRPRKTGGTCSGAGARCSRGDEKETSGREGRRGERAFLFVKASSPRLASVGRGMEDSMRTNGLGHCCPDRLLCAGSNAH